MSVSQSQPKSTLHGAHTEAAPSAEEAQQQLNALLSDGLAGAPEAAAEAVVAEAPAKFRSLDAWTAARSIASSGAVAAEALYAAYWLGGLADDGGLEHVKDHARKEIANIKTRLADLETAMGGA